MAGPAATKNPFKHLRASDLRALSQLATQGTLGVTRLVEEVHQSVWRTLGAPGGQNSRQARGLTGLIYRSINGVTQGVGSRIGSALTRLEPLFQRNEGPREESPQRAAVLAALNGVLGDRLQASANPLATPMTLRMAGKVVGGSALPEASRVSGKVLLVIHGLCMNEQQWTSQLAGEAFNHAELLAAELGYTPVYLRYNSGLHVSENGHTLARQLEDLVQLWPRPVSELSVLAHSMGGLVIRSAVFSAKQQTMRWPSLLKNIVFLGVPHHGSPLERAGNWVDIVLGSTPYSRPFARLGQLRSAGITDLRHGFALDADWQGHDRFRRQADRRIHLSLPEGVACFAVAATTAAKGSPVAVRLLGDGLVPLRSALGQHVDPARCLDFAPDHQTVAYRTSHLGLLSSPGVAQQVVSWFKS